MVHKQQKQVCRKKTEMRRNDKLELIDCINKS